MKKLIPIVAVVPMLLMALTPPLHIALDCTINSTFWLWATFFSGFLAFLFLYQKVSNWLKLFVLWCFVSCFTSGAPYMSFTMFWSLIVCSYYYSFCRQIEDWTLIKKSIQSVFLFIVLLTLMQIFGKDTLLNFGLKNITNIFGIIGNKMIASSFVCVLAPFLLFNPLNWIAIALMSFLSGSSGAVLSVAAGVGAYVWMKFRKLRIAIIIVVLIVPALFAWRMGDIKTFTTMAGRLPVYKETIQMSIKRPLGYGIGTFKLLFQVYCSDKIQGELPKKKAWLKTHNDWLQIMFETGFVGFILLIGFVISLLRRVKDPVKFAGLVILGTNMTIHFPTRMVQSAFVIIMFLAYCSKGGNNV